MNHISHFLLISLLLTLSACDSNSMNEAPTETVYVIQVVDETFRVQITDSTQIAEAERLLQSGESRNIDGPLRAGSGDVNAPYPWHLDPDSIQFADFTIEVCDGLPSKIEDDLDYWINTVKAYCPWDVKVVGRE